MPFVVLEGLDGAGKSTQVSLLKKMFAERGVETEYLHFPRFDASVYGEMIARFLRGEFGSADEVSPYLVALLFAGDRADAARMIRGWLDQGKFVILDRYVYSNIGYQCAKVADPVARRNLKEWIWRLEFERFGIPKPDLSLFLDVPFEFTSRKLSAQRSGDDREYLKGVSDIHEVSLELQRRVREVYLEAAAEDGALRVIDCSDGKGLMAPADAIFEKIEREIEPLIETLK